MTDLIERLTTALADRYTIERELGAGGMATVYLARDGTRLVRVWLPPGRSSFVGRGFSVFVIRRGCPRSGIPRHFWLPTHASDVVCLQCAVLIVIHRDSS